MADEKPKKTPRERQVIRMVDGSGSGELVSVAEAKKNGTYVSFMKHRVKGADGKTDKDKSQGKGVSSQHTSFDEAKASAKKAADAAVKLGWKLKATGPAARQDAFTIESIPKPRAK